MTKMLSLILFVVACFAALYKGWSFIPPVPLEFGIALACLPLVLCVAAPLLRSRRVHGIGIASLLRRSCRFAMLLTLAMCWLQGHGLYAAGTNLFTPRYTDLVNFTNGGGGVGSLHVTNSIHQITNGSTTVTSAWVNLRGGPADLWAQFSPTNALLTNAVFEFQFSPDGTNVANEPTLLWRTATSAIAAGRYVARTNLTRDYLGAAAKIRLWKIHFTNGVNTVGSVFLTNRGPTVAVATLRE